MTSHVLEMRHPVCGLVSPTVFLEIGVRFTGVLIYAGSTSLGQHTDICDVGSHAMTDLEDLAFQARETKPTKKRLTVLTRHLSSVVLIALLV